MRLMTSGRAATTTTVAAMNTIVLYVKGANSTPSAITVPRSLMKHAPRMPLPKPVRLKPVSSITE